MTRADRPPTDPLPVRRYRAVVAYDGTPFYGFQRQAGDTPTVQGALEAALWRVTRQDRSVIGAGRTDTGVHASGQVIAFDATWQHAPEALRRALNANVPESIALQTLVEAEADFHPRYDARSRTYEYTLYTAPVRQPLLNNLAWHVSTGPLDLAALRAAAALLLGTHDFASFGQPPQGENTVRTVFCSEIEVMPAHGPDTQVYRYTIEANAFLYRMVRRIVGALARVGRGQLTLAEFDAAFRRAEGTWQNQTAPPRGLCLTLVMYE